MTYVVTLTCSNGWPGAEAIETWGPYATADQAEQARRRLHFTRVSGNPNARWYRTFVTKLKDGGAL